MTGREFRRWRRNQELTQQQVADFVNCNKSTICRWEKEELNLTPLLYEKIISYQKSVADYCD